MSFLRMVQRGNVERIKELDKLGQRPDAIVKRFNENGINIGINMVNVVLSGEMDEMDRKALPKASVREVEEEIKALYDGIKD